MLEKALDESVDNNGQGNIYTNVEDPAWIQRLSAILANYNVRLWVTSTLNILVLIKLTIVPQAASASNYVTETSYEGVADYSNYNNYSEYSGGDQSTQQQSQSDHQQPESAVSMDSTEINKEFTEINQQLGRLNLQYVEGYDPNQQQQTPTHQYDHQMAAPSYDQGYDSINQSSLQDESHLQQQQQQQAPQDQHQQQHPSYPYSYDASSGQPSMFTPAPVAGNEIQQPSPYDYWNPNAEVSLTTTLTFLPF